MAKIIPFPRTRHLWRASGEKFEIPRDDLYRAWLRFTLPHRNADAIETMLYGHIFAELHLLGPGIPMGRGFTKAMIRSGEWHRLPYRSRPERLKPFLIRMDHYCEAGWLEIGIKGSIMGQSAKNLSA